MKISVKDISIENRTYYFLDDIINIKDFNPNNIEIDKKSYKNFLIYYIGFATIKKDLKIYSVNALYLIFGKVNRYFGEIIENKYLMLVSANESKEKKAWRTKIKIRDLSSSITKNLDDYDEKYMKIKFDSDDNFPLNKTIESPIGTIVFRAVLYVSTSFFR